MSAGYIYILTNPSFPDYIKIGYADNVEQRLQQLNQSECIPFAFRIYATYEVDTRLSDLKIHTIIDKLNPNLRSIDNFNGKQRVREFYAMSAEDGYDILEAIADIHDCRDRLKKWEMTPEDKKAEQVAEEVIQERQARAATFVFADMGISAGAVFEYAEDLSIKCTVVDDRKVEYNGEVMYITPFVRMISGKDYITHGPKWLVEHFTYDGKPLTEYSKE